MNKSFRFIDPEQLTKISDLELLARTVVRGLTVGIHRSPRSGSAIEFAQYRPYSQGDDPRSVDWKLYARTDRLHIKQYQEETNLRATIALDCSASMNYTSGALSKFRYAQMLAASLTMLLSEQRDAVGLIAYHHERLAHVPPRSDKRHARRILFELSGLQAAGKTDASSTLQYLGDVLQPRGMVILISDLLHPLDQMLDHLKSLRARRHDVLVFQISDNAERTFPFDQATTFIDAEDGQEQFAIPATVRDEYLANRKRHFESIRRECLLAEIDFEEVDTSEALDLALHRYLYHRSHALLTKSTARSNRGRV